jgi:DNA-binding response OmpR family regulator
MAHVLLIDDDEDFALAAAKALGDAGHKVKIELSTGAGQRAIEERVPDLIVLDVMFPEDSMAGFTLARALRSADSAQVRRVPILMLTAVNARFPLGFTARDIDDSWMPVTDFLEKPVDLDQLVERVAHVLAAPAPDHG